MLFLTYRINLSVYNFFIRLRHGNIYHLHNEISIWSSSSQTNINNFQILFIQKMHKGKQAARGQKQIYEENSNTLKYYFLGGTVTTLLAALAHYFYLSTSGAGWVYFL